MGLLAGCASDGPVGTPGPAALGIVTDLPAAASSGIAFTQQPKVRLTDAAGSPFAQRGVLVTAALGSGTGTLVGTSSARTDGDGIAAFTDLGIAGPPGSRTLRFSATGLAGTESGAVALAAGPASVLSIKAGGQQSSPAATPVPVRPQVVITDATGNPVAGIAVTFTASGTSTVTDGAQTTDAAGVATVGNWILGAKPGSYSLTATAAGLAAPATFLATATIGPPAVMTVIAGDNQTAVAGTAVDSAPAVRIGRQVYATAP
ncbi:MAG: Ig-like domain-containing protein, partial [Gemmatimonadota bacterium]